MRNIHITIMTVVLLIGVIFGNVKNVYAASCWSKQWNEYGDIYAAHAQTTSTVKIKTTKVPNTKAYHNGTEKTVIKCDKFKFHVAADKTLGAKYTVRFEEIYSKLNTGRSIAVNMGSTKFTLDSKTKNGNWMIVVDTKGYKVDEKVQKWAQSHIMRSNPKGTTVYKKTTVYAPAKNSSAYRLTICN